MYHEAEDEHDMNPRPEQEEEGRRREEGATAEGEAASSGGLSRWAARLISWTALCLLQSKSGGPLCSGGA